MLSVEVMRPCPSAEEFPSSVVFAKECVSQSSESSPGKETEFIPAVGEEDWSDCFIFASSVLINAGSFSSSFFTCLCNICNLNKFYNVFVFNFNDFGEKISCTMKEAAFLTARCSDPS